MVTSFTDKHLCKTVVWIPMLISFLSHHRTGQHWTGAYADRTQSSLSHLPAAHSIHSLWEQQSI